MEVYLPIAEVQINIVLILFVSFVIGFLSGLFGVGGGFLMTPFLIFMGIPPVYAVANEANNILASSSSGTLTHWFKKTLDVKMGWLIIIGGLLVGIGTKIGSGCTSGHGVCGISRFSIRSIVATFLFIPSCKRFGFVTNRSSPTN